jgi:superoxide dismutase
MAPAILLPKASITWVQTFRVEKTDVTNTVEDVHIGYLSWHHFKHIQTYSNVASGCLSHAAKRIITAPLYKYSSNIRQQVHSANASKPGAVVCCDLSNNNDRDGFALVSKTKSSFSSSFSHIRPYVPVPRFLVTAIR